MYSPHSQQMTEQMEPNLVFICHFQTYSGNSFCRRSIFREAQASSMSFLEAQLQRGRVLKIN